MKHLGWEEFWNMRQPRKHLPGTPSQQLQGLAVTAPSPVLHLSPSTENVAELQVAHSEQGMNGFPIGFSAAEDSFCPF